MINRMMRATWDTARSLWERPLLGAAGGPASESPHPLAPAGGADWRLTLLVAIVLAVVAAGSAYVRASQMSPVIFRDFGYGTDKQSGPITQDVLFDADVAKRFEIMTDRLGGKDNISSHHPLMSLFMYPPVHVLQASGLGRIRAVWVALALAAGAWSLLMFALLTVWGCRTIDSAVFTLLAQASASFMFFTSIPETYTLASATIISALILTIWPQWLNPFVRYTAAITVSFAMTVTNVMVGLIAAARRLPARDLWIVGTSAWFIMAILWALQRLVFPETTYFFPPVRWWVSTFLAPLSFGRIGEVVQALLLHGVVMPEIGITSGPSLHPFGYPSAERVMTVQRSLAGTADVWGLLATLAWVGLLGLGAWAAWVARSGLTQLCLLILACQIALHVVFGPETFLFTLHVLPLLVVLVAAVSFTRLRLAGLALAVVVIVVGGKSNWGQYDFAVSVVGELDAHARTFPGARP